MGEKKSFPVKPSFHSLEQTAHNNNSFSLCLLHRHLLISNKETRSDSASNRLCYKHIFVTDLENTVI